MPNSTTDRFARFYDEIGSLDGPATRAVAITPSDSVDLTTTPGWLPRGFMVGVAGDVVVDLVEGGTSILLKNVPAGMPMPFRVSRIRATNTTATNIIVFD